MSGMDEFIARARARGMGVAARFYRLTPDPEGCHPTRAEHVLAALGVELSRPAAALNILGFFLTLFAGGVIYIVFQNLVNNLNTYQTTYYNSGQFISLDLAAYTYGWLALPAIILLSALIALILGTQKRTPGARI